MADDKRTQYEPLASNPHTATSEGLVASVSSADLISVRSPISVRNIFSKGMPSLT